MRRTILALFLTAAVMLAGPSRAAAFGRPATLVRGAVPALSSAASEIGDASRLAVETARGVPGARKVVDLLGA